MNTPDFLSSLSRFLDCEGITASSYAFLNSRYTVYKNFSRILPSLHGLPGDGFKECVFAIPAHTTHTSRCSTILYIEDVRLAKNIGVKGTFVNPILASNISYWPSFPGYCVA